MSLDLTWPWRNVTDLQEQEGLTKRLKIEVGRDHALWGLGGTVVARSDADDDVLAKLEDGRFAIVHLTWSNNPGGAVWPATVIYASGEEASRAAFDDTRSNRE